jgi:NADH-quinone oxidoreductase subunit L
MFTAMGVGAFAAGAFHLMTHAFFKALLFLGSGSVIHAMAGEQDMRRMGGLKQYMPITYKTMFVGTLAIAGIPPLSGFFSKDEILFRTFLDNRAVWALAVVTALMTAFYMFRLMSMTFFGAYRGPAWEPAHAAAAAASVAAAHGSQHPADPHAHGRAHRADHEVTHGPAEPHSTGAMAGDGGGHGHGAWHGPHESPTAMTFPLMALALGAVVAGFVGIPAALGGGNAIEHFLEPSFTAHEVRLKPDATTTAAQAPGATTTAAQAPDTTPPPGAAETVAADTAAGAVEGQSAAGGEAEEAHISHLAEIGLMVFSVAIAAVGIALAWRFYVARPEISESLAHRFAGAHRLLSNKYYVDELYNTTVISAAWGSARALWGVDRKVVDGAVNGTGRATIVSSWLSGFTDKTFVDGLVNLVGRVLQEGSHAFRRLQTGLVQNYALLMLFGVFAFVSLYLFMR